MTRFSMMFCAKMAGAVALLALLAGCATSSSGRSALPASDRAVNKQLNSERIARVEHAARMLGTKVEWVNPPRN